MEEAQRFERDMARAVHSHEEGCRREKLFGHFKLHNPTGGNSRFFIVSLYTGPKKSWAQC